MKGDEGEVVLDCPLCGQKHDYTLRIARQKIRYDAGAYGPWYGKEFTRIFVCPIKCEKFEATLVLEERREDKIVSIESDCPTGAPGKEPNREGS